MDIYEYLNRNIPVDDELCFVIMPFDDQLDTIFYDGIKPIVEELGFHCKRADQHFASTPRMFEIFDDIKKARVVIADVTDSNPNVFYELGISHALKRHVVLLKRSGCKVPFDLHGIRHFEYENSFTGLKQLREFIANALSLETSESTAEFLDGKALAMNMKKACLLWKTGGEILIKFEDYLEIVLGLETISPTEEEIAFLCHAAAHFGKFMRRMTEIAHGNVAAIRVLAKQAANGPTARVPWRAAAMLEHLDRALVEGELKAYSDAVTNKHIFPETILKNATISELAKAMEDARISSVTRDKLAQAFRQLRVEFGSRDGA